ncbi:MAG: bifunctional demethylmenaquinone methyltransferase/2-methoxy-6-polyprenyl-1,4-benzoquinol methylase UbiE [Planctomycetota bacterium]|nr:bifunctional demethylmenaquinone methyltransferase/2-methoxy-6-polyprenyl-1,4-benzoquinol methylase UbiE [Planctomycetota bacterium]
MPIQTHRCGEDTQAAAPAWSGAELAANPHEHAQKADKVRRMFAAIAGRYDLNNRLHSFGRDQAWRRAAVRMARLRGEEEVLDVACGTGDLSRAFAAGGARRVVGLDFTPEMLAIARRGPLNGARGPAVISYLDGDATALPFGDRSFDVVSIAFGIRNLSEPARALSEFRRVLRPGGRVIVLEFSRPTFAPIAWASDVYTNHIMPRTATLISGDRSGAYHYLPRSVSTFLSREKMAQALREAGFSGIEWKALTFGICVCYRGEMPV